MNRGQLVSRAGLKLGIDTNEASGELREINFLRDLANEGVVRVLLKTHCYLERGDMSLTQGTSEYRLDPVILAISNGRGSTPSGIGPYEVITQEEMITYQSANPVGSGSHKVIAIEGDLLTVAPAPETNEVLRFWYVPRPSKMTSDTDDPSTAQFGGVPEEYHKAIERYMLLEGAEYDTRRDYEKQLAFFEAACDEVSRERRRKAGRGLRGGVVGYPGRSRTGRRDVYPE